MEEIVPDPQGCPVGTVAQPRRPVRVPRATLAAIQAITTHRRVDGARPVTVLADLRAGLRSIWGRPLVRRLVILSAAVNVFLVSFNILLPLCVKKVLHGSSGDYSAVLAAEALGGVVTMVVFFASRHIHPKPVALAGFLALGGASLGMIPLVPNIGGLVLLSFAQGLLISAFNTLRFRVLPGRS
jgi:hypothetical protein